MKIKQNDKVDIFLLVKTVLLQLAITFGFIALFAVLMYLTEMDNKFSPLFASLSLGGGAFSSAYFYSSKQKNKGYLNGLIIGTVTFLIITLIGLILSNSFTINTLFHLVIIILSSVIGGILGVNKKGERYI